jgi:transcriptional regulator with PAS, ATPase and Fis domain
MRSETEETTWLTANEAGYRLLEFAKKAARTPLSIYLEGETGVGKDLLAQAIHLWSDRRDGELVTLNCAAISSTLGESELFGHTRGAYTGANHARLGALRSADRGTLFLDEIADLSLEVQAKLLRFLESGEVRPLGSDECHHVSVRIGSATHKALSELVDEGKFRQDLYFRLASITLSIPPLRERPEDIALQAEYFLRETHHRLSPQSLEKLKSYRWPGNTRELRHSLERAIALAETLELQPADFSFLKNHGPESSSGFRVLDSHLNLAQMERTLVLRALKISHGNRALAARKLGVAKSTLYEMMRRYGVRFETRIFHA